MSSSLRSEAPHPGSLPEEGEQTASAILNSTVDAIPLRSSIPDNSKTDENPKDHRSSNAGENSPSPLRESAGVRGTVASLHIHPPVAGEPFIDVREFNLVTEKGIFEDKRYFGRVRNGKPAKRQVTLIEREVIAQHAGALGVDLDPGSVRSNIETTGIDLIALIGQHVQIGEAVLLFVEPRTPCHKMDALAQGLRELMENRRQGVIARVVKSGCILPGDRLTPIGPIEQCASETRCETS